MDSQEELKERYAEEAKVYRKEALQVNFDAQELFLQLLKILNIIFSNKEENINILDIGAGNGMLTELVFKEYPNAHFTMLDFSKEMLSSADSYFKENNVNFKVDYVVRDFIKDDFPNQKYDLVLSSYALHHIRKVEDLGNVYQKIANCLNDNGWFLCVDLFLGNTNLEIDEQVNIALKKWTESFHSISHAYEWGNILRGEDSPATLETIQGLLSSCEGRKIVPILNNKNGVMATIYGFTTKNNLNYEQELKEYLTFYKNKSNLIDNIQYKIGNFPFPNKIDN